MSSNHDFAVFIGRFQPFHAGHLHVVRAGLAHADKLIVLLGSAWQARHPRNPWTFREREQMLRACLSDADNERVLCQPLMDAPYNDAAWVRNVQSTVNGLVTAHFSTPHRQARITLIGHRKDRSGYYLNLFPQWDSIAVDSCREIHATDIRERFFASAVDDALQALTDDKQLPPAVAAWLTGFARDNPACAALRQEIEFVRQYRQSWADAPYAPTFVTVDAVVVQSGHVLLVERRAQPGKGLLALPGGFVDHDERLLDACLRELREETRLKVPEPVLRGSITRRDVYDAPYRSARGRTLTHAFHFDLSPQPDLPKVKGGDDARHAHWYPLGELDPQQLFEDHYFIIQDMLGAS